MSLIAVRAALFKASEWSNLGSNLHRLQIAKAALRSRRELPNRFDHVVHKLDAIRSLRVRRIDVEYAAAPAEFAWNLDRLHAFEVAFDQPCGQRFEPDLLAD